MLKIKIYTPNGLYKECEASSINVFTTDGQRGISENHMSIVAPLVISRFEIVNNNSKDYYAIGQGVLYFENKEAKVIVETIEHKDEIDITRAKSARDRALKRIESNDTNIDIKRAEVALARALNRINIYNL